jgi:hypothetical protein
MPPDVTPTGLAAWLERQLKISWRYLLLCLPHALPLPAFVHHGYHDRDIASRERRLRGMITALEIEYDSPQLEDDGHKRSDCPRYRHRYSFVVDDKEYTGSQIFSQSLWGTGEPVVPLLAKRNESTHGTQIFLAPIAAVILVVDWANKHKLLKTAKPT